MDNMNDNELTTVDTTDDWDIDTSNFTDTDELESNVQTSEETATEQEPEDTGSDQTQPTDGNTADDKESEETKETDQFTLKHLDEVKTVSRDEVIALAQKGLDYDRIRQKYDTEQKALTEICAKPKETLMFLGDLAKQQGYASIDAFLDETKAVILAEKENIDISIAREKVALERKERELAEKETKLLSERKAKESEEEAKRREQEKIDADFREFIAEYKDITPENIPKEVWDTYKTGKYTLVQAYMKYENAQLKAQLAAEKKNTENKAKSAGSVASGGKSTRSKIDELWYNDD